MAQAMEYFTGWEPQIADGDISQIQKIQSGSQSRSELFSEALGSGSWIAHRTLTSLCMKKAGERLPPEVMSQRNLTPKERYSHPLRV